MENFNKQVSELYVRIFDNLSRRSTRRVNIIPWKPFGAELLFKISLNWTNIFSFKSFNLTYLTFTPSLYNLLFYFLLLYWVMYVPIYVILQILTAHILSSCLTTTISITYWNSPVLILWYKETWNGTWIRKLFSRSIIIYYWFSLDFHMQTW